MVHKGLCPNCPTTQWAFGRRGSQQEIGMSVPIWRGSWGIQSIKTSLHEQSSVSFCWLYQRAVLSQKQEDGWFHLVAYGSQALTMYEKNYHSTKLEFLALKWAVMEHFKEYLLYQSFLVKTDNNPLTYIMTTPSLDATWHWWVSALA